MIYLGAKSVGIGGKPGGWAWSISFYHEHYSCEYVLTGMNLVILNEKNLLLAKC
jgi:hypothetical protein